MSTYGPGEGVEVAIARPDSGGFPRHSHDEYVLSVNVNGRERLLLDGDRFEVGTEEVTIYNPGQVQSCTTSVPDGSPWSCVSLYVSPEVVASWAGGRLVEVERPVVRAPQLRAALLGSAGLVPPAQAEPGTDRSSLLIEQLMVVFLQVVDRAGARHGRAPGPRDPRVGAVLDRLRDDLATPARVGDLAAQVGLSREQLIRCFTRATGCPPYAWQLQARLAEGRRLLRGGLPVAAVAHRLGFADQAHFSKHFRAAYAATPGRYRAAAAPGRPSVNI